MLTDRRQAARPLPEVVAAAVAGGARALVLREKDLPEGPRRELAAELAGRLEAVGGTLLVAGCPPWARHGGHLAAVDPWPAPRPPLVGRSCHDAADVAHAGREGCDYVTVSPVHPTGSKPGYGPPLGLTGLARLARQPGAPPAYALAGVDAGNAAACLRAGAYGVAVMGEVMRAAEPARTVAALLEAIDAAPAG